MPVIVTRFAMRRARGMVVAAAGVLALSRLPFRRNVKRRKTVAEDTDLPHHLRADIVARRMPDGHGAGGHRDIDVLDPCNPPYGRVDLGSAGCAIHPIDAKSRFPKYACHSMLLTKPEAG
ncbi:hypothetical protein EME01_50260 [Sinorhizobium meliloti]|nr:hypothetical protein EME01_50260 [Sinorhizobium meliloti]